MSSIKVEYPETVWNKYEILGANTDDFQPQGFEYILKEKYGGNVWAMSEDYPSMNVELMDTSIEFVDTDFEKVEVDC